MHAGYGQKLVAILADSDIPNNCLSKLIHNATRAFCVGRISIYAWYTYVRSSVAIGLPEFGVDRQISAQIGVERNPPGPGTGTATGTATDF